MAWKTHHERLSEMSRVELEELLIKYDDMEDIFLTWNATCTSCGRAWENAYREAGNCASALDVLSKYDSWPRELWEALCRTILQCAGR